MNTTKFSREQIAEIVKMPIQEQKKLLSNIDFDVLFVVADVLGNKDVVGEEDGNVMSIEGSECVYTWEFFNPKNDGISTSVCIRHINEISCVSSDIDTSKLSITFEKIVDAPFVFVNDKPEFLYDDAPLTCISGEITYGNQTIGKIRLYEIMNNKMFYESCEEESGDLELIAKTICRGHHYIKSNLVERYKSVLILDNIHVDKEYRGKGIGQLIMSNLQDMMKTQFHIDTIFLVAGAYEFNNDDTQDEYETQSDKLVGFYNRCGFNLIKNRVMYIN